MNGKFWVAVVVAGLVANAMDFVVYSMLLGPAYFMTNPALFRQDTNPMWFVIGDFIAVFVFAWVYNKVSGSFGTTLAGGAKAGLYLGVFMNFPAYIFMHLMFNGYPYSLSWISTGYGILWCVIVGTVLAAMMKKSGTTSAA